MVLPQTSFTQEHSGLSVSTSPKHLREAGSEMPLLFFLIYNELLNLQESKRSSRMAKKTMLGFSKRV